MDGKLLFQVLSGDEDVDDATSVKRSLDDFGLLRTQVVA
jgi:hypothetical protein